MRKGTTHVFIAAAAAVGALIAFRACQDGSAPTTKTAAPAGKSSASAIVASAGAKARRPGPVGSAPASPSAAADAPAASGKVVFFSPWGGSHKDQLGRDRPQEGNPMGPMSLAQDASGKLYVLDEVNHRIVRRGADGSLDGTFEMKLTAAQDIAVGKGGEMAVLDRLGDKSIAIYDPSGTLRGQLMLEGEGIDEPGHVTGVFVDGSDVYVEREHATLLKIGDLNGKSADPRTEIPGRPTRDGLSFIKAGITDGPNGRAYVTSTDRKTSEHRFTREIRFKSEVTAILLLDTDKSGTIYFAVELHEDPAADYVMLQCLEPQKGAMIGSAMLPANTLPEETFRDFTVLDGGGVVYAIRTDDGVTYRRYDCGG